MKNYSKIKSNSFFIALLFLLLFCLTYSHGYSQRWKKYRAEVFFGFGATNFFGDLGGGYGPGARSFSLSDLDLGATKPVINVGYFYKLTPVHAIEFTSYYGYIGGNDNYTDWLPRKGRKLQFRSPILEFSAKYLLGITAEQRGRSFNLRGARGIRNISVSGYFFTGIGFFYMNPSAPDKFGNWISLQPLSTEGQGLPLYPTRKPYSLIQPCIPIGIGMKYLLNREWYVGLEWGIRVTFTDYMDDCSTTYPNITYLKKEKDVVAAYFSDPAERGDIVANKQRGNTANNDSYMFLVVNFRYRIPYSRKFLSGRSRW